MIILQPTVRTQRIPADAIWNSTALRMIFLMGLNRLGSAADDLAQLNSQDHSLKTLNDDVIQRMPWLQVFSSDDLPRRELARKI